MDWAFAPETAIDWVRATCFWIQMAIAAWMLWRAGWLTVPFRGRKSMNTMGLSNADIREFRHLAAFIVLADIVAVGIIAADWAVPVDLILWAISLLLIVRQFQNWKKSRPKFNHVRFNAYALGPLGIAGIAGLGMLASAVYHVAPTAGRIARTAVGASDAPLSVAAHGRPLEATEVAPKAADAWLKAATVCIGEARSFCLEVVGSDAAAVNAAKGRLGERITGVYAAGFTNRFGKPHVAPVKLKGGSGLDHVVVVRDRMDPSRINRIYLIETKTSSQAPSLSFARGGKQLSDKWLDDVLRQMGESSDARIRDAASLIRAKLVEDPSAVYRELWWQNLEGGVMKRQSVGSDGRLRGGWEAFGNPGYVLDKIRKHCRVGNGAIPWAGPPERVRVRCPSDSQLSRFAKAAARVEGAEDAGR